MNDTAVLEKIVFVNILNASFEFLLSNTGEALIRENNLGHLDFLAGPVVVLFPLFNNSVFDAHFFLGVSFVLFVEFYLVVVVIDERFSFGEED